MKKRILKITRALLIFAALAGMFASCNAMRTGSVLTLPPHEKDLQSDRTATLLIPAFYTVTLFDSDSVQWKRKKFSNSLMTVIKVPAGEHEVCYEYYRSTGGWSMPQEQIRGNQRVTTRTYTPINVTEFSGKVKVTMEEGKGYIINNYKINPYTNGPYLKYIEEQ